MENNVVQLDFFRDNYTKYKASKELVDLVNSWAARGKVSKLDAKRFESVMLGNTRFPNQPQ
jgi:hypothetical protein